MNINTVFIAEKKTKQVRGTISADSGLLVGLKGINITGYEIHMGQTVSNKNPLLWIRSTKREKPGYFDGAVNGKGLVFGTYLHGLFHNAEFLQGLINNLQKIQGIPIATLTPFNREHQYDRLADLVRQNLDMDRLYRIVTKQ